MKESAETRQIVERFLERLEEVVESSSVAIWDDVGSYSRLGRRFQRRRPQRGARERRHTRPRARRR